MTPTDRFDLNATFPADMKHRAVLESLVAQAAEYAGCAPDVAKGFASEVGEAFSAGVGAPAPDGSVGVRVECLTDTIDVVVSCGRTVRLSRPVAALP